MTRWLCMADRTNAAIVKEHLIWGVPARYRNTIGRVHPDDTLLIYARQEHAAGETLPSVVTAAYEVISPVCEDTGPIFTMPASLARSFPCGPEKSPGQTKSRKPDVPELAGVLIHRERVGHRPGPDQDRAHRLMVVLSLPNKLPAPAVLMHPREGAGTA